MQLLQIGKNLHRAACMADNPLYFGVVGVACNKQKRTVFVRLHRDFMDFCNKRAGGVVIRQAACAYFVIDASGHAMAADDDLIPVGHGVNIRAGHSALRLQIGHDLGVVDQWAEGRNLASLRQ